MPSQETNIFLSVNHATVRYLDKILFPELTFTMHENEHWAITGKSGSGKTSLLQTILGKYNLVKGNIAYPFLESFKNKHPIHDPFFTQRQLISLVTQEPHFKNKQNTYDFYYQQRFNALDAEEAITVNEYLYQTFSSVNAHVLSAGVRFSKEWIIQNLKLDYLLNKTVIQLSHGETRRLMMAQALLKQPLLLMMDNPFMGLDANSRPFFHELMAQISKNGTQLLIVTSPHEIPGSITHILELEEGKIKDQWTKDDYLIATGQQKKIFHWQPDVDKWKQLMQSGSHNGDDFKKTISMKHIHVKYGNAIILNDISWEINKGEKWALLGHNGAGKSTLLSLISGDNPQAYANHIYLFDKRRGSGESIWDIKHKIGFVSPEMHQYFQSNSRCLDIILSGYTDTMHVIHKRISVDQRYTALLWMELLGMIELKDRKFKSLSAGSQRLVLLLRALVKNPPLLILDEPCQGLDDEQKTHFKNVIETVCNDPDKSLIYVTHYEEEIPSCVEHVLHLKNGIVIDNA